MTNGYYSKYATLAVVGSVLLHAGVVPVAAAQITADRSLVPPAIRDAFLQEVSGELALQHVQLLAANRMRPISEYADTFFETSYLREMAERYGLSDVRVDYFPAGDIWVPEEAELCMVEPFRKSCGEDSAGQRIGGVRVRYRRQPIRRGRGHRQTVTTEY